MRRAYHQLVVYPHVGRPLVAQLMNYIGPVAHAFAQHHERLDGSAHPHALQPGRLSVLGRLQICWNKADYGTTTPRWEAMPQLEDQLYSRLCGVPRAAVRRAVELSAEEAALQAGLCDALQMKAG